MPLLVVALHLMVTRTIATMVTVISLAMIGTGDRTIADMMDIAVMAVTHSVVMMVGGITVMMGAVTVVVSSDVMMEGGTAGMIVVLPRVAVVVVGPPLPMLTPSVRFARNMATLLISAGGAILTVTVMMKMTLALVRRVPMGLIPTGIWTAVLLII
jgi:hypothetical protein